MAALDDPTTLTQDVDFILNLFIYFFLHLNHPAASRSRLMPRIMTMNGDHQSVAAAPLDLRTTHRERGTPGCTERVRDARTGADSLEKNGASSPGSHGGASRKRLLDSSSLPLRKRPFPVEPESRSQSPVPAPSAERFPPAEDAGGTGHQGAFGPPADAGWILPASAAPRRPEEAAAFSFQYLVRKLTSDRTEISHLSQTKIRFGWLKVLNLLLLTGNLTDLYNQTVSEQMWEGTKYFVTVLH